LRDARPDGLTECYSRAVLHDRGTRDTIVGAAMECVVAGTWDSTSLQAVRQRAGVSNGSLFHYFHTRQDLDAAVVGAALGEHQRVLLAELPDDAELGVTGVVRRHLQWVDDNREVALMLLGASTEVLRLSLSTRVLDGNRRFFAAIADWLRKQGWRECVGLPVVLALWIGPAQEFSRQQLTANDDTPLKTAADALARGAWAALSPLLDGASTTSERTQGA